MKDLRRTIAEIAFWVITLPLLWGLVVWNRLQGWARYGHEVDYFRYYTEEVTSCVGALVMVGFVAWWMRTFPLRRDKWLQLSGIYLLGSFLFALGHFVIYIALRIVFFSLNGMEYHWQAGALYNFYFEYQKDIGIYIGIVAVIAVYVMFIRPGLTGEAIPPNQKHQDRLIVQTGRGEAVLAFDEIEYLEAARNYVTIYARGKEFLVRETLQKLSDRLEAGPFQRCHRSFIVNIDKVAEVRSVTTGGQVIELREGRQVPLGKSYRESFQSRLTSG